MAEDHTPQSQVEDREDDRLLDIWLFTLFALSVLIFVLFAAPKGCHEALQEKETDITNKAVQSTTE